jgi:ankyrin repeat protein
MLAARNGHVDVVKRLLAAGADTERRNEDGRTAVIWALEKRQTEAAELIENARRAKGLPPTKVQLVIE